MIDWLIGRVIDWLSEWLIDWLIEWVFDWLVDCLIVRSIGWLVDCLIVRSIGWLVDLINGRSDLWLWLRFRYEELKSGDMHFSKDKLLNFVRTGGLKELNVYSYELLEDFLQFCSADWYSFVVSDESALIFHCEKAGLFLFSTVLCSLHSSVIDFCC